MAGIKEYRLPGPALYTAAERCTDVLGQLVKRHHPGVAGSEEAKFPLGLLRVDAPPLVVVGKGSHFGCQVGWLLFLAFFLCECTRFWCEFLVLTGVDALQVVWGEEAERRWEALDHAGCQACTATGTTP